MDAWDRESGFGEKRNAQDGNLKVSNSAAPVDAMKPRIVDYERTLPPVWGCDGGPNTTVEYNQRRLTTR